MAWTWRWDKFKEGDDDDDSRRQGGQNQSLGGLLCTSCEHEDTLREYEVAGPIGTYILSET